MQKNTLQNPQLPSSESPSSKPIRHLDAGYTQTSRVRSVGNPGLVIRLLLGGALVASPFIAIAAQQPQNTKAPASAPAPTQSTPAKSSPAKAVTHKSATAKSTLDRPGHTSAAHRRTGQHATKGTTAKPPEAPAVAQAPPPPPPPDWPANHQPNPATVVWDSRGLQIQASNSSLEQILHEVATNTGAKVEGLGQGSNRDQRVFGTYGPGPAREVISKLLDGSGYNVLMIGGSGDQPPQQIILSSSATGPPPPPNTGAQSSEQQEDQDVPTEQNVEQDYRPPDYPMPARNPFGGPAPRTPQEMQQQIQQRQQQLDQMRQQQQQQGAPQPQQQPQF